MFDEKENAELLKKLSEVFGAQKAEWLGPMLFDLFAEPSYFPRMTTARPCVLIGGRGTGKTTVLRGLSYEGQYNIRKLNNFEIKEWPYFGLYYRVDTNRVSAFQGPELTEAQWIRKFAHYINLLMCIHILRFLTWFKEKTDIDVELDLAARRDISNTLHLKVARNNAHLFELIKESLSIFEGHINNVVSDEGPELSMQGAPVQCLIEALSRHKIFQNKMFFFLIDEYENFQDYQQRLMNTLIKHSGELYTFKIGVRELGWRVRNTLNENEQLISPADYIRIDINQTGAQFETFALKVCQDRLTRMVLDVQHESIDIRKLLPGLSDEEEAKLLGIEKTIRPTLDQLKVIDTKGNLSDVSPMTIYLLEYWSRNQNSPLNEVINDYRLNKKEWSTRMSNYSHSLLYTIAKGKGGIRKYYSGWDTFVQLSGGNIRYLLQLVEESINAHLKEGKSLSELISPKTQTQCAQQVGRTNLTELEGLAVGGAKLTKLLLGLGRVFGVLAASPEGLRPEIDQFEVVMNGEAIDQDEVDALLKASIMHLALVRMSGSKPLDETDTRDWDYMLHPIYAAFFNISYRRKRKLKLTGFQLLELVKNPRQAILNILSTSNRSLDDPLPEQLKLFEMYYADQT